MKKLIFALILVAPLAVFGATQVIKEYKIYDNFASIQVSSSNNVNLIKVDDPNDPSIKCYVAVSNVYTDKAFMSGISCVKVK